MTEAYMEAQAVVIGSVLINPQLLSQAMTMISEEDFAHEPYAALWRTLRRMWLDREVIDPVTLLDAAGQDQRQTVKDCMDHTPTWRNFEAYARVLKQGSKLYRLQNLAEQVINSTDLDEVESLYREAESITATGGTPRRQTLEDSLMEWYNYETDSTPPDCLQWGLSKLQQNVMAGPGDFVVLGADSSVGKTALAVQMAYSFAQAGKRVGFFSVETSTRRLSGRLVAQLGGVKLADQQARPLSDRNIKAALGVVRMVHGIPLDWINASAMSLDEIRAATICYGYDVVIVDYLQLLDAPGRNSSEEVRAISKFMHKMAIQLNVTVLGLSQLTVPDGAGDNWRPTFDDLRESRQLKLDAEIILLLYLASRKQKSGNRWLEIAKNKEGKLGRFPLKFDGPTMVFSQSTGGREAYGEI